MALWLLSILFSLKNAVHKSLVLDFFFWQFLLVTLYCLASRIQEDRHKNLIFFSIALASTLAGIYGANQHYGIDFVQWGSSWGNRPSSTFGNPNFAAGWWVMTIPIFAAKFFSEKNKIRWMWLLLSLLMLANLYWGRTRGAWIASALSALVGLMIWFWFKTKLKIKLPHGAVIAISFTFPFWLALCLLTFSPYFFNLNNPSVIERYFKWATAWQMVKDYPAFGVGAGNLKTNFAIYQAEVREKPLFKKRLSFRATSESNVHNEFFQIWAEMGSIGLLAFFGIFLCYFYRFLRNLSRLPESRQILSLGIATSILAFLAYSLTNFPLHIVPNACLLFFLLGISENSLSLPLNPLPQGERAGVRVKEADAERGKAKQSLQLFALFIALFFLTKHWIFPPWQADYFRLQAEIASHQNNFSKAIALYERVIQLDFYRSERTAYDLGEVYRKIGKIEEALKAYQISVALRNYGEIYNNIGNCYYLLGKKEEALKNWRTAIHLGLPDSNAQKQTEKNIQVLEKQ